MYKVSGKEVLKLLESLPQSDIGAPLPVVMATEDQVCIAYFTQMHDPTWDGTFVQLMSYESRATIAILEFKASHAHQLWPLNECAIGRHPLAKVGLTPFAAFEVLNSLWTAEFTTKWSDSGYYGQNPKRHFILTFHHSVFECVALDVAVLGTFTGDMNEAADRMKKHLFATTT